MRSRSLVQAASAAETAGGGSVVLGMASWDAGWNMLGDFSGTLLVIEHCNGESSLSKDPCKIDRCVFALTMGFHQKCLICQRVQHPGSFGLLKFDPSHFRWSYHGMAMKTWGLSIQFQYKDSGLPRSTLW